LRHLTDETSKDPNLFRAYIWGILSKTFFALARGDLSIPKDFLKLLNPALDFVETHLPDRVDPRVDAARELALLFDVLELADEAVGLASLETQLRDRSVSETERRVLEAVLSADGQYRRRGEVWGAIERMHAGDSPSVVRVGQVLQILYEQGILLRIMDKAPGARLVSFYALSQFGRELCNRLKLSPPKKVAEIQVATPRTMDRESVIAVLAKLPNRKVLETEKDDYFYQLEPKSHNGQHREENSPFFLHERERYH